ncbi:MAG: hypothetical protein ACTH2Q_14940 [Propionibacteriaceae bacterium]
MNTDPNSAPGRLVPATVSAGPASPSADSPQVRRWVAPLVLVLCVAAGVLAMEHQPYAYVARTGAPWFVLTGALVAISGLVVGRTAALRNAALLVATVFLLPAGGALLIIHGLRLVGAIPMPLDVVSAVISVVAAATLVVLWVAPSPLRPARGSRLAVPRWVAVTGALASLVYPALKVSWALGSSWVAPAGTVGVVDATFAVTTALSLVAAPPLVIALRWWNRPAPRWARPAALVGGMVLTALGASGLWSTWRSADEAVTGLFVYGGWLVWGLCTVTVSRRLTAQWRDPVDHEDQAMAPIRTMERPRATPGLR